MTPHQGPFAVAPRGLSIPAGQAGEEDNVATFKIVDYTKPKLGQNFVICPLCDRPARFDSPRTYIHKEEIRALGKLKMTLLLDKCMV